MKNHTAEEQITDPVCGMVIEKQLDDRSYDHKGRMYYFCSKSCLEKFKAAPEHYIEKEQPPSAVSEPMGGAGYTCPMHPEVQQDRPGDCPKCGMALELRTPRATGGKTQWTCPMHPEVVRNEPGDCPICGMALEPRGGMAGEEEENREYIYMRNRFWVSAVLTVPLVLIAMRHFFGIDELLERLGPAALHWSELILATPVVLWGGWIFYVRAWRSEVTWNLNMFTLI